MIHFLAGVVTGVVTMLVFCWVIGGPTEANDATLRRS